MPEPLKESEVNSQTDPSVAKQWDNSVSIEKKLEDFYAVADKNKIGMLATYRDGIGPVARAMAVSHRSGPDFLFLANAHSQKFKDLSSKKEVTLTFHNSTSQDWINVTGEAVTTSNSDPRIKEIWSRGAAAWFGDLGDGVHTGGPEDPRMKLIEVQAKYVSYWKATVGAVGFVKEIVGANITGDVANTGVLREMKESELAEARKKDGDKSSETQHASGSHM